MNQERKDPLQRREMLVVPDYIGNIPGSALVKQGNTQVLCTAQYENRVPPFLKNSGKGWIQAEY